MANAAATAYKYNLIFIHSLKLLNKAEVRVQLVFVVFVRTDVFVEQNRRTKTQYVGPLNIVTFLTRLRCYRNRKISLLPIGGYKF
jgi:hypothetical protein